MEKKKTFSLNFCVTTFGEEINIFIHSFFFQHINKQGTVLHLMTALRTGGIKTIEISNANREWSQNPSSDGRCQFFNSLLYEKI